MTSTELAVVEPATIGHSLHEQMDYARAVSVASMLPEAYRGKPADIMLAVGLGQSMGLSPAESLYRINVIKGKPTASAELIAANVRKAGHRLRVQTDAVPSATATIIRADDPEFEFTVTRDADWARQMGLLDQANYKKQPETMLTWRAITAVARLACPEALYGVSYTPDEMWESTPTTAPVRGVGLAAALHEDDPHEPTDDDVPLPIAPEAITKPQLAKLHTVLTNLGMERDEALPFYASVIGHPVESSKELSKDEAGQVIDALEAVEEGR